MRNVQFWRLRDDDFQTVVSIPKQVVVAKEVPRAQRRSRCAKFGKDRLYRSAKRRAWERLKIDGQAAPSVLLPPFENWITLHSPTPLAVFTGTTCSLKSSSTRPTGLVSCVTGLLRTGRGYLCANGLHAAVVQPLRPYLKKKSPGDYPGQKCITRKGAPADTAGTEFRKVVWTTDSNCTANNK